jgi:hypothetical protein
LYIYASSSVILKKPVVIVSLSSDIDYFVKLKGNPKNLIRFLSTKFIFLPLYTYLSSIISDLLSFKAIKFISEISIFFATSKTNRTVSLFPASKVMFAYCKSFRKKPAIIVYHIFVAVVFVKSLWRMGNIMYDRKWGIYCCICKG